MFNTDAACSVPEKFTNWCSFLYRLPPKSNRAKISTEIDDAIGPVPAKELRYTIMKLEELLGASITRYLVEDLEDAGIAVSNDQESYFLHEIREALHAKFGEDAAQLIIERIRSYLASK